MAKAIYLHLKRLSSAGLLKLLVTLSPYKSTAMPSVPNACTGAADPGGFAMEHRWRPPGELEH